jgi:hypothetical protein
MYQTYQELVNNELALVPGGTVLNEVLFNKVCAAEEAWLVICIVFLITIRLLSTLWMF